MIRKTEKSSYYISVGVLIQLMQYLSSMKVDTNKLLRSVGIEPDILELPDERVLIEKYIMLEDAAARAAKDPWLGLHMGQIMEAGNWTILGYMMMNCKTIGEAFRKYAKYSDIIGNLIKGDTFTDMDTMTICLTVPEDVPVISRHCYEGYLSSLVCLARTLSGEKINPVEVGFTFSEPDSVEEYQKVFGSSVLFNQTQNYMVLDKKIGDIPVSLPNENLLVYFENYAKEFLAEVVDIQNVTYQVKKLLLSYMDNENLTIQMIAKELSMSVRTLQTRLKNDGTEFSILMRYTKEELAKKYLRENYTIEDITYLLGFSDSSAFRKAFKKWVGLTPKEYREKLKKGSLCI